MSEKLKPFEGLEPEILLDNKPTSDLLNGLLKVPSEFNPIFVIGCPRSGTTLLGNILGGNENIACADESMFLLDLWNMYSKVSLAGNRRESIFLSSYTSPQKHLEYLAEYVQNVYTDLLESKPGARTVVDHTPVYSHLFNFIELIFGGSFYVHITRNEADVIKSLAKVREKGGAWGQPDNETRRQFRNHWIKDAREIKKTAPDRYFELSYEDLVENPELALTDFLTSNDYSWSKSMTDKSNTLYAQ